MKTEYVVDKPKMEPVPRLRFHLEQAGELVEVCVVDRNGVKRILGAFSSDAGFYPCELDQNFVKRNAVPVDDGCRIRCVL